MNSNSYEEYADIKQDTFSAVGIILEYINEEDLSDVFQSSHEQKQFARNYSASKIALFKESFADYSFSIKSNKIITTQNAEGKITYSFPTNFMRFLISDKYRNNILRINGDNQERALMGLSGFDFKYIAYIKDKDTEATIPFEFYELLAYHILQNTKSFKDKLTDKDLFDIRNKSLNARRSLAVSYL